MKFNFQETQYGMANKNQCWLVSIDSNEKKSDFKNCYFKRDSIEYSCIPQRDHYQCLYWTWIDTALVELYNSFSPMILELSTPNGHLGRANPNKSLSASLISQTF